MCMIKSIISGKAGEGARHLIENAIRNIIKEEPDSLCFIFDHTSQFVPLKIRLNGFSVGMCLNFEKDIESNISKHNGNNLYLLRAWEIEYHLQNDLLKEVEDFLMQLQNRLDSRIYLFYCDVY